MFWDQCLFWTPTRDGSIEGIVKVLLVEQDDVGFSNSITELEVFTEVGDCGNFADDIDVNDNFVSCKRDEDDGDHGIDGKDNCNDDETGDDDDADDDDDKDGDEDDDEIDGNDELVELELIEELAFLSGRIQANNIIKL